MQIVDKDQYFIVIIHNCEITRQQNSLIKTENMIYYSSTNLGAKNRENVIQNDWETNHKIHGELQ